MPIERCRVWGQSPLRGIRPLAGMWESEPAARDPTPGENVGSDPAWRALTPDRSPLLRVLHAALLAVVLLLATLVRLLLIHLLLLLLLLRVAALRFLAGRTVLLVLHDRDP